MGVHCLLLPVLGQEMCSKRAKCMFNMVLKLHLNIHLLKFQATYIVWGLGSVH